jgi:tRNA A37 threonylcarbamoyltransferase TsaD
MKYYKDAENNVYAYESDGSQDAYIKPGLTSITEEEADALRFPPPTPNQMEQTFSALVTDRLNAFAAKRQYDNIASARLAGLSSEYAVDGQTANASYASIWTAAIALVPQVRSRELTPEQAVERLPALAWPGS